MKEFLKKYSYTAVQLFVKQFAIALFGLSLAFASGRAENTKLQFASSIVSILFYLFLVYANIWEVGAKDGIRSSAGREKRGLWRGFAIGALANALNILIALLALPGAFTENGTKLKGFSSVCSIIGLLLHGEYDGVLAREVGGSPLNSYPWMLLVIILPAVIVTGVGYILGSYELHFTNILIQKGGSVKKNKAENDAKDEK